MERHPNEEVEKRVRKIVADNLGRLMKSHRLLTNANRLSVETGVSASTIKRVLEEDGGLSIDTLTRLADALEVQPFHLLVPDVDRSRLPAMPALRPDDFMKPSDTDLLNSPEMTRWVNHKPSLIEFLKDH